MQRRPITRRPVLLAGLGVALVLAGCAQRAAPPGDGEMPWKETGSSVVITAAPDAGGVLSFRNCPTLDEARAAVDGLIGGPDANAVPFKTMVLQCSYDFAEPDAQGRPAGVGVLVFDASAEGVGLWASVLDDPSFPNPTDIPDLGDRAFATGNPGHYDLWVVERDYGFHMLHTRRDGVALDQMVALGRRMLAGLERPPR